MEDSPLTAHPSSRGRVLVLFGSEPALFGPQQHTFATLGCSCAVGS